MSSIRDRLGLNKEEEQKTSSFSSNDIRSRLGITQEALNEEAKNPVVKTDYAPEKQKTGLKWIDANLSNIDNKTYQNAQELSKYQNENVGIKLGSTIGDVATNIGRGFLSPVEGAVDLGRYGVAGIADLLGAKEYANDVRERAKQDTTSIIFKPADDTFNKNSMLKENGIIENVAQGLGQVGAIMGSGALLPGKLASVNIGKFSLPTTSILTGAGSGMTEAYNNGASNEQAVSYGALSGLVEGFSESLFGGLGKTFSKKFGGGALDDVLVRKLTDKISNKTLKTLAETGIKSAGEGIEEVLSGLGSAISKKLTYMSKEDIMKLINDEDLLNSFVVGALTSAVAQTPSTYQSIKTNNINIPKTENISQNGLNLTSNINTQENVSNTESSNIRKRLGLDQNNQVEEQNQDIFSKQVDEVLNGTYPTQNMLIVSENTPQVLQNIGLNDLPITMTQRHLKTIMNPSGEYKGANYHDLGVDIVKQLPQAIANPLNVLKSNTKSDSIVVITELADKQDRPVIASIKIDGKGQINDIEIDTNVLTSAYGKDNYDSFMKKNIANGNMLYDIDEDTKRSGGKLQLRPTTSSINDNTTNSTKSQMVLSTYNMQQNENNIQEKPLIPTIEDKTISKNPNIPSTKNTDVIKVQAQNIANQINKSGGFDIKERSWIETSTESETLKDKVYIEDLNPGKINYVVQSNKKSLEKANRHLDTYGYDETLKYVNNLMQSDKLPSASDVALMQRMIQEASKRGDAETVQNLIMDTAIVGTDLGQATQALSIIKKLTPEGQLKMYTKLVQRAKARGEKSFQNVKITPEMVQNVLEAYNENGTYDQEDLNARVEQFKQDIANQMKKTAGEKIDAWRYLSMLGNPKTHIRNLVSNVAMKLTSEVKNAMARTMETVLPIKDRTKTWRRTSDVVKEFSKKTANDMKGIITGEAKYNEKSSIEAKKQIFKFKPLEKISNFNGNALEFEDWLFSKSAFKSSFQEYLTANKIKTEADIQNNPEIIEKAKIYAVEQAEIATFRQYSKLASMINQFERKSKVGKLATSALMPFKKTPINVAKAGVNYSPLGLIKSMTYDAYQLKQGNINASQFIDNLSQGLTGTSLTLLGYALAKASILTGSGGDDKDDKYDKQLGKSGYSLNIGGNSYSISWLSPVAMPLLVGSNAYEQLEEQKDWDMNIVSDTLAKTLDPLNEMSFMQGLTNALQSYGSGTDKIKGALESTVQNYVGQFFPTIFSQLAATTDDKKRSTKASNNSSYKFGEQTVRSIMYKVPGLRQQLEVATDIWGNEKEQSNNILERAFESFIAPYSKTKDISTDLDKEIKRVYNETGESGVIPSVPYAYIRYGNETYRMSANEYTEYKKTYGQNANKYLNNLINSSSYKSASTEMKAKMIDNVYDYARAEANEKYFKNTDIDYTSDELKELNELKKVGIDGNSLANYVADKTQVSSLRSSKTLSTSEKKQKVCDILTSSSLNNDQLSYLYSKYYSDEQKVNAINSVNIPIKQFIKYDLQDFESDYNSSTGKAINGSKKDKIINYVNSLNLSVAQKALLIKLEYNNYTNYDSQIINYVKSSRADFIDKAYLLKKSGFNEFDSEIINYVQQHYKTAKEKEEILKNMGFTVRNGRVYQ